MRKFLLLIGCVLTGGLVTVAVAQTIEGLDIQKIEQRGEAHSADAQALLDFVQEQGTPQAQPAQDLVNDAYDSIADLDVSSGGGSGGPIDLDEMVAGAKKAVTGDRSSPLIIAFVSLSMPEDSLRRTIADTTRAGGVVVFRGFSADGPKPFLAKLVKVVDRALLQTLAQWPRLGCWIGRIGCDERFQGAALHRRGHPMGGALVLSIRHQLS